MRKENQGARTMPVADHQVPQDIGTDALHTIREACHSLSIGTTKCWELIGAGHLVAVRLGGRCTRIKKSSIDRLIQGGVSAQGGANA